MKSLPSLARALGVLALPWGLAAMMILAWAALAAALPAVNRLWSMPFYVLCGVVVFPLTATHQPWRTVPWLSETPAGWRRVVAVIVASAATIWLYQLGIDRALHGSFVAPWTQLFAAAVVAPVFEEWLFRGFLWNIAREVGRWPNLSGLVLTSVSFGLWHHPLGTETPLYIHAAFGLSMGLVRFSGSGLLPCVVLHALGNATIAFR
jgi:membrane protease YdiL (CAAX protease family)